MKKTQYVGDKLTFSINTNDPISVKDLTDSLVAFSNEYIKSSKLKDSTVRIMEVRKGSYIFDVMMAAKDYILPMAENTKIAVEFVESMIKIGKFFSSNRTNDSEDEYLPTKQEAENIKSILQPIYNITNNGTMTITVNNDNKEPPQAYFSATVPESHMIKNNATKYIKQLEANEQKEEEINFFNNKLLYFVQTRLNSKDKGQKSICEEISKEEVATAFANQEIQNEIMSNPYFYEFFVDIKIHRTKGKIKVYEITNIHQKIERETD